MHQINKLTRRFSIFFLLLFWVALQAAEGDGFVKGKVTDKETHQALTGVNVFFEHTTTGAATDEHGNYVISNAPFGEWHVVASIMGYQRVHEIVRITADETITLNFELKPTILEMGAVVVTGTSTPHLLEDTPVRTEVIPRRIIEQKQAINLAEALSFQTGIRVENNCSNCNFSQVRILGMDGKYSQILIDGDPVISSLAGVYGLEHFPEEMVDQIEVVKGGGSSLYGGGAVAGVVNMITRRPLLNQVRIKYQSHSTGGELDQHVGAVAETVFKKGTSGAYVFGSFRKRNPYDHNEDGFSELGELRNETIGFKWYYQPFMNSELLASLHQIHEERRGGNKFDQPVHEAEIAEWLEHWRTGGSLRWSHRPTPLWDYRVYYSFSNINRKSYFGGRGGDTPEDQLEALTFYGKTDNPLQVAGFQTNYRMSQHLFTGGVQYSHDQINDKTAAETAYFLDEVHHDLGIFLQDNLHFGSDEQLEFVVGARMDQHSELENWIFSPRLNAKFEITNGLKLRAAYTTGFKPPQTYDEDLHLCGLEGDQRIIRNSSDLREERSHSYSGGLEFTGYLKNIPTMFSLTAFYIRLSDSFSEQFVIKQGNIERWERVNSDGADVKGIEIELGLRPLGRLEVRTGVTYKKSQYDTPNEDFNSTNFFRTPDLSADLRLSWNATNNLDLFANGRYLGEADVPHEKAVEGQDDPRLLLETSDAFVEIDLGLSYRLPLNNGLNAKINLGIKNALDAFQDDLDFGADRDPAYVYGPTRPRSFYFGLETSF
jgi:outer membrane receptor for ferrienterochelin and colicins